MSFVHNFLCEKDMSFSNTLQFFRNYNESGQRNVRHNLTHFRGKQTCILNTASLHFFRVFLFVCRCIPPTQSRFEDVR